MTLVLLAQKCKSCECLSEKSRNNGALPVVVVLIIRLSPPAGQLLDEACRTVYLACHAPLVRMNNEADLEVA